MGVNDLLWGVNDLLWGVYWGSPRYGGTLGVMGGGQFGNYYYTMAGVYCVVNYKQREPHPCLFWKSRGQNGHFPNPLISRFSGRSVKIRINLYYCIIVFYIINGSCAYLFMTIGEKKLVEIIQFSEKRFISGFRQLSKFGQKTIFMFLNFILYFF